MFPPHEEDDSRQATIIFAHLVGELPRKDVEQTDQSGFGGFVNIPPGPSTITATVAADDQQIATVDVFTRAGFASYVGLPPSH